MYQPPARRTLPVLLAAALTVGLVTPAQAAPADPFAGASVATVTDTLAHRLAAELGKPAARSRVTSAVAAGSVDLAALPLGTRFAADVAAANHAVRAAKGLPDGAESLLRVRLADASMRAQAKREVPLVASAPSDDEATAVTAYDAAGGRVVLAGDRMPLRPVLVVEVDTARALPLGIEVLRQTLAAHQAKSALAGAALTGGYWATKVDAVRLSDDKEPWIKGDAEIYTVVSGFGLDGHPKVDIVQMPYLNKDGTTYYPNQLLVHFSAYKYNLADAVMMEDDGDTNYLQLAQAIAAALLTIADAGVYIPLVSAILDAMPSSWWTDDPDYVDSWYTLATTSSGRLNGAAANGWMDVSPYWVAPL
ncbi:hypothetical protein HDA40_000666 [Hamadaea flava]|uniref:DUF3103 family protein n=1 Tax=Hamadaea flava TaxID=1742688 RepID=A0ABV8LYJ5_9ACTN|nr:DUF3103 family protein [Hamadaea flava]MCP2322159.1 hypothetical protein [Hamadaea flava]